MSKSLYVSGNNLLLDNTAYPPDMTIGALDAGRLQFRSSSNRLEFGNSSGNGRALTGYDLGSTTQPNGAIWGSAILAGGLNRLYVAHGGRKYGFLPYTISSNSVTDFGLIVTVGTGWRTEVREFPAVASGRTWIVSRYHVGGYRVSGSNATNVKLEIIRSGGAIVLLRQHGTEDGTAASPTTWTGNGNLASPPGTNYQLNAGDKLRVTVSQHNTGQAMGFADVQYVNVPTSVSVPLVQ